MDKDVRQCLGLDNRNPDHTTSHCTAQARGLLSQEADRKHRIPFQLPSDIDELEISLSSSSSSRKRIYCGSQCGSKATHDAEGAEDERKVSAPTVQSQISSMKDGNRVRM